MNNSVIEKQNQIINFDKLGKLSEYSAKFKIGTLFWELILHFCHLLKKRTGIMKPALTLIKEPVGINVDRKRLQYEKLWKMEKAA